RICPWGCRHDGESVARQRTRHSARGSSLASAAGVTISSASNARKLQLHERNRMKSPYSERGDGTQSGRLSEARVRLSCDMAGGVLGVKTFEGIGALPHWVRSM